MKGRFIALEGIEGVGKSTAIEFVASLLREKTDDLRLTREPGGTPIGEQIRSILLADAENTMSEATELLLMFAARAQHMQNLIVPALQAGQWVLSDRFVDASFAYQGGGRGVPVERIAWLEQWIVGEYAPDLVLILDAPVAVGQSRRAAQRSTLDRIESEETAFFERVRQAYLARAKAHPERYRIIDATQSLEAVQEQLRSVLEEVL